jgi:hypothetical protein
MASGARLVRPTTPHIVYTPKPHHTHHPPRHTEKELNQSSEALVRSLATYEKAFAEIRKVTGLKDIKALVARFQSVEDENFSLFNYVSQVNNDIEVLAEEMIGVQRKVDTIKVDAVGTLSQTNGELKKLEVGAACLRACLHACLHVPEGCVDACSTHPWMLMDAPRPPHPERTP